MLIVYLDRDGYRDVQDNQLSFLDCLYYATVSLSTTGYGDITPFTPSARLINVLVITPLRVAFLIVLIGTTVETLTEASRQTLKIQQWRRSVRDHIVVVGYGTKGKTAVSAMIGDGAKSGEIVVVDTDRAALDRADKAGLVTVHGDANRADVLRLAGAQHAKAIVVATNSDPTAVLVTLTARELAPKAKIIASIRESENQHLLLQSGADSVVVSSETAGRLLGMAANTPTVVELIEDLLTPDAGFAIAERDVTAKEVGGSARHLPDIVLGVVREGTWCGWTHRRPTPWSSATDCSTSATRTPTVDRRPGRVPPAQRPAAVARRRRPGRRTAHRRRRRGRRLERRAAAEGRPTQSGADLRRPGGARAGRPSTRRSRTSTRCSSGRMPDGRHVWAVRGALEGPEDPHAESEVLDLRRAGAIFDDVSAQLVATATALLNWHDSARFSAIDGSPTKAHKAGWSRVNPVNGHEEFPRTDPAVICLIHDGHDRAVLARQTVWPERLFSLIAGFVEAGESFEGCVVREVAEEIGLTSPT